MKTVMSAVGSRPLTNLTRHAIDRSQPVLIDTAIESLGGWLARFTGS